MRKTTALQLLAGCLLFACCKPAPEKYFATAALNCNMLYGFAGPGMERELTSPSEKLVDEKTYATAPMKRAEVVDGKLGALQVNFEKVKALPMNEDAKEMIMASLALYEFTLPVYKNEYKTLASLYDDNASADKIAGMEKTISDKYEARFEQLYDAVMNAGKAYAARHQIEVQEVNPSPGNK
jgi:hypothetical protein